MRPLYKDRRQAGEELADALARWSGQEGLVVLGLARGGVPVAAEVADRLAARLDVVVVRKLGLPGRAAPTIGAVAAGGVVVRNEDAIRASGIGGPAVEAAIRSETVEVARRDRALRGDRPPPELGGQVVLLVDDGLATGTTMRAAVGWVRAVHPHMVLVAAPVGDDDSCEELGHLADRVVCPHRPADFRSIARWYDDFTPTTDDEVIDLLHAHWRWRPPHVGGS